MFKNYLKIAWRNLKRYKGYSFINTAGLVVGMAAFILIMLFLRYELSFDRHHENADRIYRIARTPLPLASALMEECPEVVSAARIWSWGERGEILVSHGETHFHEIAYYADPEILDVFSIPFIQGDPETALDDTFSIILSRRVAEKYFGNVNPLGKVLTVTQSSDWRMGINSDYIITGIFENMPANSHFVMDLIVPYNNLIVSNRFKNLWNDHNAFTYLLLDKRTDPRELEGKLSTIIKKYEYKNSEKADNVKGKYPLKPLTSLYMDKDAILHFTSYYDVKYIYLYASIAMLILIVACINYINLTTALSIKRRKEVGIRKVVGARRAQLIKQFLSESFILIVIALTVSIILVMLFLPYYNNIIGRPLSFDPAKNTQLFLGFIAVIVFMGIVCGGYPAFYISSIRPATILSGKSFRISKEFSLRNILVIAQFSITTILIICTLIVKNQLHFIQNKNMGFDKEQVIVSKIEHNIGLRDNIESVKAELKKNPNILAACCSGSLPNDIRWRHNRGGLRSKKSGEFFPVYVGYVDYDFIDVFGIEIIEGRNFSRDFPSEVDGAVLINQTAAKECEWDSLIGKEFRTQNWDGRTVKIVGIMKDFHSRSLHQPISPLFLGLSNSWKVYLSIKINTANVPETIDYIEKTLKEFAPGYVYEFKFFDEAFEKAYKTEHEMGNILSAFAFLSVFIGGLGLFGLASFTTEQRTKELGIRKVLGASAESIMSLLLKDMTKCVLIANVITWPLAYFLMHKWLQNFTYRISINWWIFMLAAVFTLGIAVLTVCYKVIRAASANPVDSLRYE